MSKIFRRSQINDVLGGRVWGGDFYIYGLPYIGEAGIFAPAYPDEMDMMFAAVKAYPELHILSEMPNDWAYNCYKENALFYSLYKGNADPDIIFNAEWDVNDEAPEKKRKWDEMMRKVVEEGPTQEEMDACRYRIQYLLNRPKS